MTSSQELLANCPSLKQWQAVGIHHHHGINLPLSALHSEQSAGIGEFPDLLPLIDWLADHGFDTLQLLPLNDSAQDPSPYNALSAFALHPIYLGLANLPYVKEDKKLCAFIEDLKCLNQLPKVAYHEVLEKKEKFFSLYFQNYFFEFVKTTEYQNFILHEPWLKIYALFKVLRNRFGQKQWLDWPREYQKPSKQFFSQLIRENEQEISYFLLQQYLCFQQLKIIKKRAEQRNILIKGDIPILISPDSADVWHFPQLFQMKYSAGAPPDMFNPDGQYWGFPTYLWPAHRAENFAWWKSRLRYAQEIYHLYRIDHVIGFYRIWQMPRGKPARKGEFIPKEEVEAVSQGEEILQMMLDSSSMLPIAEDLGFITACIQKSLKKLGIPGIRVVRWERYEKDRSKMIPIQEYYPINLTTVSTHDSETLELWWKHRTDEAKDLAKQKGWNYTPELPFEWRLELLADTHRSPTLFHINLLQEYLALFPELVWPNPEDERINIPGFVLFSNWTYRFRPSIIELTSHKQLSNILRQLVSIS